MRFLAVSGSGFNEYGSETLVLEILYTGILFLSLPMLPMLFCYLSANDSLADMIILTKKKDSVSVFTTLIEAETRCSRFKLKCSTGIYVLVHILFNLFFCDKLLPRLLKKNSTSFFQFACERKGIIVSNDQYRDVLENSPEYRDQIEQR